MDDSERDLGIKTVTFKFTGIVLTIKIKSGDFIMVEMNNIPFGGIGNGKKRMLPSEIAHKFSSKQDFLNFFS